MVSFSFDAITGQNNSGGHFTDTSFDFLNLSATPVTQTFYCWKYNAKGLAGNSNPDKSPMEPGVNFKRLNFLALNTKYTNSDLTSTTPLTCNLTKGILCSDDVKHFSCQPNYYLDVTTSTCNLDCPVGWMRLPNDLQNKDQEYCIKQCDSNTASCPSLNASKRNIAANFSCNVGFYNYNYNCITQAKAKGSKNRIV